MSGLMEDNSNLSLKVRLKDAMAMSEFTDSDNIQGQYHFFGTKCDPHLGICSHVDVNSMKEVGVYPLKSTASSSRCAISSKKAKRFHPSLRKSSETNRNSRSHKISSVSTIKGLCDNFVLFRKCPQPQVGNDNFCKLSDEIVLQIFRWLPKSTLAVCAQVNKRWKALSCDESLWKRINLGKRHVPSGAVGTVIERGVVVLRLAMSEIKSPVFSSPITISSSKLQYLDLSMATISENDLTVILSLCRQLRKVSLEHCSVNDDICSKLAANSTLEELNMSMCSGLSSFGIGEISLCNLKLKAWNLAWVDLKPDAISILAQHIPSSIERLNISGCKENLQDKNLSMIFDRCPNLIELDISDATSLTCCTIYYIVRKLLLLEHLHCSRCYEIKPTGYLLLQKMKNLRALEIFYSLTDNAVEYLAKVMPHIKINEQKLSTIARPTRGTKRTSIWGIKIKDCA